LQDLARKLRHNSYGDYLLRLADEDI